KFALVENFWETGFGMPSFTLLGPKIIRFPFIINSSYPHEILHNWWGNSVFPDSAKGNWSEGLTAYLSDHLIKEQQGSGVEYRETTLQKYADYVVAGRDFPLVDFRSRHSSPSEAVGYGKSLMFFHMLRRELGDRSFIAGLQDFYNKNKFSFASFDDLRTSFEKASGKNLKGEFEQWIERPGAPEIRLSDAKSRPEGEGYLLTAVLEQIQEGKGYRLAVPIVITMEAQEKAYETVVNMENRQLDLKISLPSRPLRIDVDPQFDLFRRLKRDEVPPAISQALGTKRMVVILPSSEKGHLLSAYRKLAKTLGSSGPDEVEVKLDTEMEKLPPDSAVTIMGWENRFLNSIVSALSPHEVAINQKGIRIEKTEIPRENHSVVLTVRNPQNKDLCWMFIASDKAEALRGLGRKLPHYHKYSYLGFEGDEPENIAKGRWPILDSPMTAIFSSKDGKLVKVGMGMLAPRKPLAEQ
ncbi:MAG TPA: M1 family aminopeptidase, partial [Thermodesulfovibrionales bacterium]|nr:M1 family aminopeptidase [Thermodesulfovibrionales bacterium]